MTDLKAKLDALSEAATPGPWFVTEEPWFDSADGIVAGSPDGNICAPVADFDNYGYGFEYHHQGSTFSMGDKYDPRADTKLVVETVNAYRSGDLIVKDEDTFTRAEMEAAISEAVEAERESIAKLHDAELAALVAENGSYDSSTVQTEFPEWVEDRLEWHEEYAGIVRARKGGTNHG